MIKFSSLSAPAKIEELTTGSDEKTQRSPAVPAVSSSIFVGAKREENLIRNVPDKSEFTKSQYRFLSLSWNTQHTVVVKAM